MTIATDRLDHLAIDTIRTLAIDAVQKANSGHPGAPMGMAPMAYVLWTRFLRHAPTRPDWPDRDRFVLSAGHASMLLYALLHLTGYDLPLDELERFRQWGSRTPGHPEYGLTPGVEATTGPLGQGVANAVGMAIAERRLGAEFNRPGPHGRRPPDVRHLLRRRPPGGHRLGGRLAGRPPPARQADDALRRQPHPARRADRDGLQRGRPGPLRGVRLARHAGRATATTSRRSRAAIDEALADERPSLIAVRTHIGYGSPNKQDSQKAHGSPLGPDEVRLTKEAYGWDPDRTFYVPDEAAAMFSRAIPRGESWAEEWEARLDALPRGVPGRGAPSSARRLDGDLRPGATDGLKTYAVGEDFATRQASQAAIQALAGPVPELFGGAADLSESNLTDVKGAADFAADEAGRNLRFGVREHAMGGIANGIAYHGGFIPYAGTFLNFSDYMRGSVRLAALAGLHVIYVWTHDSVGLGEDGPTHQPVEHYAALRAIPNLWFVRPGDANETSAAWARGGRRGRTARSPSR